MLSRSGSMRHQELTQATPGQPVDDKAMYYNVAGECPRGRVYSLGLLGRKKRRYVDPGAITSKIPDMVPRLEFDSVVEQLRLVVVFMWRQFGMTMDGAGHLGHGYYHHLMSSRDAQTDPVNPP
ncbi:hypothetical protein Syun_013762 [Stephania yunnanensis]|uniref:Uncharacterized protein n=1 Tax=Stephania yunnanensis TaxID=152371 RepID=A0AAP0JK93_9MAGN